MRRTFATAFVDSTCGGSRRECTTSAPSSSATGRTADLHISFTHDDYEGLTLVTRLKLYDEQGQRLDNITSYAPAELMEQADTRDYPNRSHAIDGVLYV